MKVTSCSFHHGLRTSRRFLITLRSFVYRSEHTPLEKLILFSRSMDKCKVNIFLARWKKFLLVLHFKRFMTQSRIFHVTLISLLFLASRPHSIIFWFFIACFVCIQSIISSEWGFRYCLYNFFFWLNGFNNLREIQDFVILSQLFSFYGIRRKTSVEYSYVFFYKWVVSYICILIHETPIGITQGNIKFFSSLCTCISQN